MVDGGWLMEKLSRLLTIALQLSTNNHSFRPSTINQRPSTFALSSVHQPSTKNHQLSFPGHAPHAALVVATGIGLVVGSLNASKARLAFCFFLSLSPATAFRNAAIRKSSLPSARSTRSRNAARSITLLRAS